jgi:hypothetical protein
MLQIRQPLQQMVMEKLDVICGKLKKLNDFTKKTKIKKRSKIEM